VLSACLDARLCELVDAAEVLVYFNRNIDPLRFSLNGFTTIDSDDPAPQRTEYLYQRLDNDSGASEGYLRKLTPSDCRTIVAERVVDTVRATLPRGATLAVGVSGGGDSNALLYGLSQVSDHDLTIAPMIVKGIAEWDLGVPRATELCASYGLELTILEEADLKEVLGVPRRSQDLADRFERAFVGDDFEFFGTLLIRLALSKHCRDLGTAFMVTGLNLEDVVCENVYRLSTGLKPASAPKRVIGDHTLVLPLWLCPKRIIDGCFPSFSRENYDARYPCASLGRNLYYSLIYALQSQFPGYLEQLARGLSELAAKDPVTYDFDESLGFEVERLAPFPVAERFKRMLRDASPSPPSQAS